MNKFLLKMSFAMLGIGLGTLAGMWALNVMSTLNAFITAVVVGRIAYIIEGALVQAVSR